MAVAPPHVVATPVVVRPNAPPAMPSIGLSVKLAVSGAGPLLVRVTTNWPVCPAASDSGPVLDTASGDCTVRLRVALAAAGKPTSLLNSVVALMVLVWVRL